MKIGQTNVKVFLSDDLIPNKTFKSFKYSMQTILVSIIHNGHQVV